jgi:hypothetical protein
MTAAGFFIGKNTVAQLPNYRYLCNQFIAPEKKGKKYVKIWLIFLEQFFLS